MSRRHQHQEMTNDDKLECLKNMVRALTERVESIEHSPIPHQDHLIAFGSPLVIEHRYTRPTPRRIRLIGAEVGKQTDLPEEIKQELEESEHMLTKTIKADEFYKVEIVSTEAGGQPAPIDTDEPIRHIIEEGTIRVVASPELEADGKRYLYFVPSSAGTNTGRTVVDGEPGSGQTFIEEPWSITVEPAVTPATNVGLTGVSVGKQTALPQAIKDLLVPEEPPV